MIIKKRKADLFGKFDPVMNAVLKTVTPEKKAVSLEKAARQPDSPTARQPDKEAKS